jgi:predicted nucleotidyltransferase
MMAAGSPAIRIPRKKPSDFCRRHYIRRLALFGSVLRPDFSERSDVDVLVEFDPAHNPGFFALGRMEEELSQFFGGRKIDLVTEGFLSPYISKHVLSEAKIFYVQR